VKKFWNGVSFCLAALWHIVLFPFRLLGKILDGLILLAIVIGLAVQAIGKFIWNTYFKSFDRSRKLIYFWFAHPPCEICGKPSEKGNKVITIQDPRIRHGHQPCFISEKIGDIIYENCLTAAAAILKISQKEGTPANMKASLPAVEERLHHLCRNEHEIAHMDDRLKTVKTMALEMSLEQATETVALLGYIFDF